MGVGQGAWVDEQSWVVARLVGRAGLGGVGYGEWVGQGRWGWGGLVHACVGQPVGQVR